MAQKLFETYNNDPGSLHTGDPLNMGDLVLIHGENKVRRVTYVMGKPPRAHACFKGQGAVPTGPVTWELLDPDDPNQDGRHVEPAVPSRFTASQVPGEIRDLLAFSEQVRVGLNTRSTDLLISGFDSAWTRTNSGAMTTLHWSADGVHRVVVPPTLCSFVQAPSLLSAAEREAHARIHIVAIDQPIVVPNQAGRRPVEAAVSHVIGKCGGGVQPANRSRIGMFDDDAPVWEFIAGYFKGNPACLDPVAAHKAESGNFLIEVFPALALLGLFPNLWDQGRLPKYNPGRPKTFSSNDWKRLGKSVGNLYSQIGVLPLSEACNALADQPAPKKAHQDLLDSMLCLLVGLVWWELGSSASVVVGDTDFGYMVSPASSALASELGKDSLMEGVPFLKLRG